MKCTSCKGLCLTLCMFLGTTCLGGATFESLDCWGELEETLVEITSSWCSLREDAVRCLRESRIVYSTSPVQTVAVLIGLAAATAGGGDEAEESSD